MVQSPRIPLLPGWFRWSVVIALWGFVFYFSVLTAPPGTPIDPWKPELLPLDKWRHFVAYAVLGGSLAYALDDWTVSHRTAAVVVIGTTVLYGAGIEFSQAQVPDRYFSLGDAYANALGALLVLPWYLVRPHIELVPPSHWTLRISDRGG